MKRTTIMLPDELDARLRFEAARRGVALADVAREALASYLAHPPDAERFTFVDLGAAGDDVSERVDEEVGRLVRERHEPETGR